jgi:RimJ/RimL family protein N-acetyltransferase
VIAWTCRKEPCTALRSDRKASSVWRRIAKSMVDPILREFPYSLETDRLIIRGPLPGDGQAVREAVLESKEELRLWMPWAMEIPGEMDYEKRVREGQLRFLSREDLWMFIFLKESQVLIGSTGLHRIDWEVPKFEIGYWIRSSYARQGYITEAVNGITNFAFDTLDAKRVEIRCDKLNERSAAVARRTGFEHEATLHNHARHHLTGALRDTLIFAKFHPG